MKVDDTREVRGLMTELHAICAKLPGSEEYVMVHHPAFRVGKKPFAIAGMQSDTPGATVSVNLGPEAQPGLLDDARFARTRYIGQHGWVTVAHADLKRGELAALVMESWRRIAGAKLRAAFDSERRTSPAPRASTEAAGRKRTSPIAQKTPTEKRTTRTTGATRPRKSAGTSRTATRKRAG